MDNVSGSNTQNWRVPYIITLTANAVSAASALKRQWPSGLVVVSRFGLAVRR